MKPAFSYYGGKQRLASRIVKLIPRHTVYVEPFAGGAAVFFAKPWPNVTNTHHYREVLNDTNGDIVHFYRMLRDHGEELEEKLVLTPYSKEEHSVITRQETDDPIERARRFFVDICQSFSSTSGRGWGRGVFSRNHAVSWMNRCDRLIDCVARLRGVCIEHDDAVSIIKKWDSPQTFFYCDPPYVGADQGAYSGYTEDDFQQLLDALDDCDGSFLLSCYAGIDRGWEEHRFDAHCSASKAGKVGSDRTRKATSAELGDRKRVERVYRRFPMIAPREEVQRLYDSGKYNCFCEG